MWFRGKDVLNILEYGNDKDHRNRTLRQLEQEDRQSYGSLIEYFGLGSSDDPNYHINKEIYINEPGLYQLISISNKLEAKKS